MSIKTVNQFLTKVSEDQQLQAELSQAMSAKNDHQAATKVAAKHGYNFTPEELGSQVEQVKAIQAKQTADELDEKELEAIAGGEGGVRTAAAIAAGGAIVAAAINTFGGDDD